MKPRLRKSSVILLQAERNILKSQLDVLDELQTKEDTMRQRLRDIEFLLGGEEQR